MTASITHYHAVMIDETGCEFPASVTASSREAAHERLRDEYPESRCVQLESPEDTRDRESAMHDHIAAGGDWDDEGRPIFHYPQEDDDFWECEECGAKIDCGSLCDDCADEIEPVTYASAMRDSVAYDD